MKYYIEITLQPSNEIPLYFLWKKIFPQIHLGLVENQDNEKRSLIGISFPEYSESSKNQESKTLGSKLRLFAGEESELVKFNAEGCLSRLLDYVHITCVREIPEQKINGYAIYSRHQPKVNKERLARRYLKREEHFKNIIKTETDPDKIRKAQEKLEKRKLRRETENKDFDEAVADYRNIKSKSVKYPFIRIKSLSNSKDFCLWIKKTKVSNPQYNKFSTYGLSSILNQNSISTIPEF